MRQSIETARVAARAGASRIWHASRISGRSSSRRAKRSRRRRTTCRPPSRRCRSARSSVEGAGSRIKQERATLENARYDLSKVRIESPIDGIVTRRNIQEGETAVIGTMNNAGTVLLTLADMSVIQAEVEVDETNIPNVQLGQPAKIIDRRAARPDLQGARHARSATARFRRPAGRGPARQATNFKVVVDPRRADSRRAARLHLHGRHHDRDAAAGRSPCRFRRWRSASWSTTRTARSCRSRAPRPPPAPTVEPIAAAAELKPGQTRKETEGVFVVRDGQRRVRARSSSASPATSTSRCCRASSLAIRSSPALTTPCAASPTATRSKVGNEQAVRSAG